VTTKAEQKERTHESILDSAAGLLRTKGISGARVADVMKGAGLTVGGFYAHFASKEALVDDALRRTGREMRARLFAGLEAKPKGARAEVVLKRYLSPKHRDAVEIGCPLPAVAGEIATTAPEHGAALGEQVDFFAAELEESLPGIADIPRRHLALALLALMYGGLTLARALRGTPLSDEMIRACRSLGRLATDDGKGNSS
jgi:TetR/AcrR family transcriptional regulator, transcriptional repressor for nem operon